jgi:hypothetical protein
MTFKPYRYLDWKTGRRPDPVEIKRGTILGWRLTRQPSCEYPPLLPKKYPAWGWVSRNTGGDIPSSFHGYPRISAL